MSDLVSNLDPLTVALLVVGGIVAGFMNVVAGGGSLITMPLLIFLGVPPTVANGSARLAILLQNSSAAVRYGRGGKVAWREVAWLALPTVTGAGVGAFLGSILPDSGFQALLGWVTLAAGLVVAIDLPKKLRQDEEKSAHPPSPPRLWTTVLLFGVGIYGGMIQAGVGYLFLAVLTLGGGFSLVAANIHKVVLILAYTPIAIAVFAAQGKIDWVAGAVLAVGQAAGGWLGAVAALKKGARLIRFTLVIVVLATAVKLLVG